MREGANPNNSTRIYIPARTRWRTVPGLKGPSFQGRLARSPNAPAAIFAKVSSSTFGNLESRREIGK